MANPFSYFPNFLIAFFFGTITGIIIGCILGCIIAIFLLMEARRSRIFEFLLLISPSWFMYYFFMNNDTNIPTGSENQNHEAIILGYGERKPTKYALLSCGLETLIDAFENNNPKIFYKIYRCTELKNFEKLIEKPEITHLWIFGHGIKHGIELGETIGFYCDIKKIPRKHFIGQYHCNTGGGKSLADYNHPFTQDITDGLRNSGEIRTSIRKRLSERGINTRNRINIWIDVVKKKIKSHIHNIKSRH